MKLAAQEIQQQRAVRSPGRTGGRLPTGAERCEQAVRARITSRVVVVTGGPGSGKSVIALRLLGELFRQGRTAEHATGSKAFTETLRKVAGTRNTRVKKLFGYFNQFARRRAELAGRAHPRRGAPHPGEQQLPLHAPRPGDRQATGPGADRRCAGAGLPARRASSRASG